MSTGGFALAAALLAVVLAGLVGQAGRLARRRADERTTDALAALGNRMDVFARELGGALDRVHRDGALARALLDLGQATGLDEVLSRVVEAVAALPGVDAVLVRVETGDDGAATVASSGLLVDLAEAQLVSGPPDGRGVRAVRLGYRYADGAEPPGAFRSGLAVPIDAGGEILGFVAVYSFDTHLAEEEVVAGLEDVARTAAPAVEDALAHAGVSEIRSTVDLLTGLRNRSAFHDVLAREVAHAARLGRPLALLVLDLDRFRDLNQAIGQIAADRVLAATASAIRGCARDADVTCRIGGDAFAVVLPDSTAADAEAMFARAQAALLRQATDAVPSVTLSGGVATLRPDDDALTLYQRADDALRRAKAAGRGTAV